MSLDAVAEREAIVTRLLPLCGGRQFVGYVPEESELARDANGMVRPYLVITFGTLYPLGRDRSIEGADQQPHVMPVIVECWAPTFGAASDTAGAVRTSLTGFEPTENASEIELFGGGRFPGPDQTGRPSRFMESVAAQMVLNMSIAVP